MSKDKDLDRFYKKMLLNSTYGTYTTSPNIAKELAIRLQNELKIIQRDEKIDKLLE